VRQAELGADGANLIFEECAQRLDQLELQVVWQPANVVVTLDASGCAATRLNNVWVERALN